MLPHSLDGQSAVQHAKTREMRSYRCSSGTPGPPIPIAQTKSYPVIWRPWVLTSRDNEMRQKSFSGSLESANRQKSKSASGFQHPVRLCMPKSKAQEYLSHLGWKVLASFPVQATLHFYDDDSSSEDEDEEEEAQVMEEP
ncbi:protein ripply3 [Brienomyrus brachyistius]|uniref:protein ripply3 n=1 Tax=Brienomyrus brachyistius TaxID=42636 RepID=UPI0020B1B18C|nr:protein ripply3 [Brienomyrus brachyistius]